MRHFIQVAAPLGAIPPRRVCHDTGWLQVDEVMSKKRRWCCLLAGFVLPCASLQAQNLLLNPDFDRGLAYWDNNGNGTAVVDQADGSPSAPAAQFATMLSTLQGGSEFVSQCVSLTGSPPPWDFGARVRIISSTGSSCQIDIFTAFDTGTCGALKVNDGVGTVAAGTVAGVQGDFTQYAATTNNPLTTSAHAAVFSVLVICTAGNDSMIINVDHAYLGSSGTTPVRLQSFDVE